MADDFMNNEVSYDAKYDPKSGPRYWEISTIMRPTPGHHHSY